MKKSNRECLYFAVQKIFQVSDFGWCKYTCNIYYLSSLLDHLSYQISYVISFSLGVLLSYMLSKYFVFGKSGGSLGLFWLAGVYLGQLFLGMVIVEVWVRHIKGPVYLAPLISVTLTIPLIFFLSRIIFRK